MEMKRSAKNKKNKKNGDLKKNYSVIISSDASRSLEACFQFPPPLGVGGSLQSNAVERKQTVKRF